MTHLKRLLDIRAIEQAYFRYAEVIDAKDFGRLAEIFQPDAIQDYRGSNGILQNGATPLIERLQRNMGPDSYCSATQHNVTNIRIRFESDRAVASANFYAVHAGAGPYHGQRYSCWGEYSDVWVRWDRGWRIQKRDYRNFLTEGPVEIIRGIGWHPPE